MIKPIKWSGVAVVVLASAWAQANVITNGDFENGSTGWTVGNTDVSATVESSAQSSFNIGTAGVEFIDGSAGATSPYIKRGFTAQADGQYAYSLDFKLGAIVNAPWVVTLRTDSSLDEAFKFQIRHNNLELRDATSAIQLVADNLVAGTWYHVEMVVDSENNQWVSGSVTDGASYRASWNTIAAYASSGQFNEVIINDGNTGENASFMIDNISVTAIPEPVSIGLLGAGAVVMLFLRRITC